MSVKLVLYVKFIQNYQEYYYNCLFYIYFAFQASNN